MAHGVEPPLPTVVEGLTTFLEALVTNMVEVEVTTFPGVVVVGEVIPVVGVVVWEAFDEVELDVEEGRDDDDEFGVTADVAEVAVVRVAVSCVLVVVVEVLLGSSEIRKSGNRRELQIRSAGGCARRWEQWVQGVG